MRTLKKTLALVLVVAMVLSMGVIGASASFDDVAESDDYYQAITLLSGLGVINGMTETTFEADGTLTRAQAAKIITYVKLGATTAELVSEGSGSVFTDVASSHWASGYIEYCYSVGIIDGVGDDMFDPEAELSVAAFTKMLLVAAGVDGEYTGSTWTVAVATAAVANDLYISGVSISDLVSASRGVACQLAFQALFVSPSGSTGSYTVGGVTFDSFLEAYLYADATGEDFDSTGASDSLSVTVFGLSVSTSATDSFGRPGTAYTSSLDDDMYIFFVDDATFTFTSYTDVADTLSTDYTLSTTVEATYADKDAITDVTGNGTLVELYDTDADTVIDNVVVITTSYEEVTVEEVEEDDDVGAYTSYTVDAGEFKVFSTVVDEDVDVTTATVTGTVADGDYVLVYTNAAGTYAYISVPETVTGAISSRNTTYGYVVIGGTTYYVSACGDISDLDPSSTEATYALDAYGYVAGVYVAADVADTSYYAVTSAKQTITLEDGSFVYTYTVDALAMDGTIVSFVTTTSNDSGYVSVDTSSVVTVNKIGFGTVVTVATDDDGYYYFEDASATEVYSIDSDTALLADGMYASSATKFFVADMDDDGDFAGTFTVYTGYANVPSLTCTVAYAVDASTTPDGVAEYVVVYEYASDDTTSAEYAYMTGAVTETTSGFEYSAIVAGEYVTYTATEYVTVTEGLYESAAINADGELELGTEATQDAYAIKYANGILYSSDAAYTATVHGAISDDVAVYIIDESADTVTVKTIADVTSTQKGDVTIVVEDSEYVAIYVIVD